MLVLPLCYKNCPNKIPSNLSTKLGDGADGEVFLLNGEDDKVIKLSILVDYWEDYNLIFSNIENVFRFLMHEQPSTYARVFNFSKLTESFRYLHDGSKQNFILYSYVMEKCFPLSEDEKKVFHSILSHEDLGIEKNYSEERVKEMLSGMARGLDFDEERIIFFYGNFKKVPIHHRDLHVRNIMKDAFGNFKLVDFDRTTLEI